MTQKELNVLTRAQDFIKMATEQLRSFEDQETQTMQKQAKFETDLRKVAKVLYEADWLLDDYEKKAFIKKAKEDPSVVLDMLIKISNASGVTMIGRPARVAVDKISEEMTPVMKKAFGMRGNIPTFSDQD